MGSNDIAIHDLQIAMERGIRDICNATAKVAKAAGEPGEAVADALAECSRPATYATGVPVPQGYIVTCPLTLHLATGEVVPVGVDDEVLAKNGVIKVYDPRHGGIKVVAMGNVAFVAYHSDKDHLW